MTESERGADQTPSLFNRRRAVLGEHTHNFRVLGECSRRDTIRRRWRVCRGAAANPLYEARSGMAGKDGQRQHAATIGEDDVAADNLLGWPIPPLDQNIWREFSDQPKWCGLVKDYDVIDPADGAEHRFARLLDHD